MQTTRSALDSLVAVLLPSKCRICTQPLLRLRRVPVCDACVSSLQRAQVNACSICGEALDFASPDAPEVCGLCRRAHPEFDFAISFGAYDGALRRLVHLLKYERVRPAASILGERLAEVLSEHRFAGDQLVLLIPVPLHRIKRRQRGFNQSELIARCALRYLNRDRYRVQIGNLQRIRATVSQTGLTRHQRRQNVRGAFVINAPEQVRDRSLVLVDDVYTTGTTLNECARVLRKAGAREVVVATVARVYRAVGEMKIVARDAYPAQSTQEEQAAAVTAVAG